MEGSQTLRDTCQVFSSALCFWRGLKARDPPARQSAGQLDYPMFFELANRFIPCPRAGQSHYATSVGPGRVCWAGSLVPPGESSVRLEEGMAGQVPPFSLGCNLRGRDACSSRDTYEDSPTRKAVDSTRGTKSERVGAVPSRMCQGWSLRT